MVEVKGEVTVTQAGLIGIWGGGTAYGIRPSEHRFYEARGLLTPTVRQSGRRRYDEAVVQRVPLLVEAQRAGFSLAEIRKLLECLCQSLGGCSLITTGSGSCRARRSSL